MDSSTLSTACPLCGVIAVGPVLETHTDSAIEYTLHECASCTAQFWLPLKNPGSDWYEHDTRYADRNTDPILKPNQKHIQILNALKASNGRLLDVGCGVGNFAAFARSRGWDCWGIDFDADAIQAGKQTFGLEHLYVMDLQEFATAHPELRFDLITFFDVFEHLDNHQAFVESVSSMLAPGGRIAFSLPYRHGWRWLLPHDLPPRHLTRWDEPSLSTFFTRFNFTALRFSKFPASYSYLLMKIRFRYGMWATFGLMRKAKAQSTNALTSSVHAGKVPKRSIKMRTLHTVARTKDLVLFGIPASVLWFALLFTDARYTDLLCIATKTDHA